MNIYKDLLSTACLWISNTPSSSGGSKENTKHYLFITHNLCKARGTLSVTVQKKKKKK